MVEVFTALQVVRAWEVRESLEDSDGGLEGADQFQQPQHQRDIDLRKAVAPQRYRKSLNSPGAQARLLLLHTGYWIQGRSIHKLDLIG